MKEIIVNEKNSGKIIEELEKVQSKAWMRTVRIDDISNIITKIERFLPTISKKALDGTVVHYMNGEHFPNRYKGTPYSTQFKLRFHSGSWRIYDICRDHANGSKEFEITLSESAKAEIIKNIEGGR